MQLGSPHATTDVVKRVLPERSRPGRPLGRHVLHDPRSRLYPASRARRIANAKHLSAGLPLIQDEAHRCSTAHALCAALNCTPNRTPDRRLLTGADALRVYEKARALEPFELDGYDVPGSSGLLACKAACRLGLIGSYEHAFGVDHALEALVLRPVMTGFKWYSSFDSPDRETGLVEIAPGAEVRGGHEVLAEEIDADRELVWFWNSWGPEFGIEGRFCLTFQTWAQLLEDRGDVTVPIV